MSNGRRAKPGPWTWQNKLVRLRANIDHAYGHDVWLVTHVRETRTDFTIRKGGPRKPDKVVVKTRWLLAGLNVRTLQTELMWSSEVKLVKPDA